MPAEPAVAPADIVVYIALSEEYTHIHDLLKDSFESKEFDETESDYWIGTIRAPFSGREYRVVFVIAGEMGPTTASSISSFLIDAFRPSDLVVVGVAGSLSGDLSPGDVFIPSRVVEYMKNSGAITKGKGWKLQISTKHHQTSKRLVSRFRSFHVRQEYASGYQKWKLAALANSKKILPKQLRDQLVSQGLDIHYKSKIVAGDDRGLASGPTVGKAKEFTQWLKTEVDRKLAAIDMESAGVYEAGNFRKRGPRVLALRPISDFADERKSKLEKLAGEKVRAFGMCNAVSLLLAAIEADVFAPEKYQVVLGQGHASEADEALMKRVFVIGGETGAPERAIMEEQQLRIACRDLGRALADAKAELVVCSPFPRSADFHAVYGYCESEHKGVVHFHSPSSDEVRMLRKELEQIINNKSVVFKDWFHPGYEAGNGEQRTQAYLLCQLQALEGADAIVAVGGNLSGAANTLLHLAEIRGIPIIPFTFLGGAAKRVFDGREWARLNPDVDISALGKKERVKEVVSIGNQMIRDLTSPAFGSRVHPERLFISRASGDSIFARSVQTGLAAKGFEIILGDDQQRPDQEVLASISNSMLASDVCVILWSKEYALSPFCYDELMLALNRQGIGKLEVWLFDLDGTPMVPKEARRIRAIRVSTARGVVEEINRLAAKSGK
jgi:nucleoside phosphorylase